MIKSVTFANPTPTSVINTVSPLVDIDLLFKSNEDYLNKFKNRGRNYNRRPPKRYEGNTTSQSGGGCPACINRRVVEKKLNQETERLHIVDIKPVKVISHYRKNFIPTLVPNIPKEKANQQLPEKVTTKLPKSLTDPQIVALPQIDPKLYLGNRELLNHPEQLINNNIKHIIDLSTDPQRNSYLCTANQFSFTDSHLFYSNFINLSKEINNIISEHSKNILIICDKGVNASTAIIVSYAILKKGYTFTDAIDYIDTVKLKTYPYWNSLTNKRLKNLLKLLKSD
jgi:hypothetical protein